MSQSQARNIKVTVGILLLLMVIILAGFVHRISMPRVMSAAEMKVNGLFLFDTPRDIGEFALTDHRGAAFDPERLEGRWTLVFFGFTHCPDICPTTLSFLNQFVTSLESEDAADTQVVMVSVDPARDTVEQLAKYVPYFNPEFIGVTGEFLDIHRFATSLNTPFRKVTLEDGSYQMDHGSNVALINPRGDYHGFFKSPLDQDKMQATYRSARTLWNR